jgi:hypothetical protein
MMIHKDDEGWISAWNVTHWQSTNGTLGETDFDENDLLAVFDTSGSLIGSARLRRPTYVEGKISRSTAAKVYDAWAGKRVFVYRNSAPGWIPYLGLALDDGFRDGSANKGEKVKIDLHNQEQTNGCIFIVAAKTPAVGTQDLRTFEPALITKVLAAGGADEVKLEKGRANLGTMRVVTITL